MFARFGRQCQLVDMEDLMPTDPKLVNHRKMIFFPSSSDIFVENAKDYVSVCHQIIDAGHEVFFATKPSIQSITAIDRYLGDQYKSKMVIFVTITTDDDQILRQYEPYAPLYEERVNVIRFLVDRGYNVNIMMEPYLSDPRPMLDQLLPIIGHGIIAVGGMNYSKQVKFSEGADEND